MMPVIKIQHIHSVSSEDTNHPADNLLNPDTYRKWKCATAGEKKAIVVLQLEKSSLIHSVDVGNEGSAFVEVLLGRSSTPDIFEVLVGMSTLMTPIESKQWSNTNRVRMFGKDKLAKPVAEQKWDRVKIVCTQPFNKKEAYGLSFLKLHSPPDSDATPPAKLGAFSLKEETKDLPTGSLFFKKEPSASSPGGLSMAAKARAATSEALKSNESDPPLRKPSKGRVTASSSRKRAAEPAVEHKPVKKPRVSDDSTEPSSSKSVPFKQIMAGIVFTLSGFKNPFRADLRGKATDMGATFQSDWTDSCTHLVCAFPNTPKFNQVKAKGGLIVSKAWITDSHVKKQRLPAKKYRLSDGDSDEDEEYDKKEEAISVTPGGGASTKPDSTVVPADSPEEMEVDEPKSGPVKDTDDMYGGSTDEESDSGVKLKALNDSSECDTEDEIERAQGRKSKTAKAIEDLYGGSTDEEETTAETKPPSTLSDLTQLPDLFSSFTFLLYGNCSPSDRHLITRYITAYNGRIESYMGGNVSHVLSLDDWDNHFDQALSENNKLVFVKPQWIFVCHQKQTCVPYQPYVIVPK